MCWRDMATDPHESYWHSASRPVTLCVMNEHAEPFIACGMYSFTPELQQAWRSLFEIYLESRDNGDSPVSLNFEADQQLLYAPGLVFGHTCGYPLMTRLKDDLGPFCVPIFKVPGSEGRFYSSRFIARADSAIESVEASRGGVAAINGYDSNSGMNVLRYAVSQLDHGDRFFSDIAISGGHLYSLQAVARGNADIAAIDCVSYQLIQDSHPELTKQVRTIGFSVKTCGLPFVMSHSDLETTDCDAIVKKLNQALKSSPQHVRSRLHLTGFEPVDLDDYLEIIDLETRAASRGYAQLR